MNATNKIPTFHLTATLQLPGSKRFDTKMGFHTETQDTDVSLALEFKNNLANKSRKHGIIDIGEKQKRSSKQNWINREHNKYVEHQDVKYIVPQTNFLN